MKNSTIFYALTTFLHVSTCKPVVILIHGSFATQETWYRPNSDFYQILERKALYLNHTLVAFSWSGSPIHKEIRLSGQILAKLITSYPANEEIILIGHSHGGNVINIASTFLHDSTEKIDDKPFQPLYDLTFTPRKQKSKKYHIQQIYLLGTPIDTSQYMPNMNVIEHLYNFYSNGDIVQPVLGLFKRTLPAHERIANISIMFKNKKLCQMYEPSHTELHCPLIAQWILAIPNQLKHGKIGNFENFHFGTGEIRFEEGTNPFYHQEFKKLLESDVVYSKHPNQSDTEAFLQVEKVELNLVHQKVPFPDGHAPP